jgi:EAL domain
MGSGRGGYEGYDPEMYTELVQRVQLEADLRRALEAGELFLQYQPTFDLSSGQIVGAEALARWKHPIRGLVPPTEFIPLAETSGLIRPSAPGCCARPAGRRPTGSATAPRGRSRWPSASTCRAGSSRSPRWSTTSPRPWRRAARRRTRWSWR